MNVIVVSQKLNKAGRIENFSGNTLGELLNTTTTNGIVVNDLYNSGEIEVIVNPGNIVLRGLDSVLPQEDIKVFFTIKKNKAGMEAQDINKLSQEIKETIKTAQKQSSVQQRLALKQTISEAINNFFGVPPVVVEAATEVDIELQQALAEAQNL